MESTDVSSQERLDQMLRDGKVTEEDYRRLAQAMNASDRFASEEASITGRRKLRKHWEQGVIGGLLAGVARYFDTEPWIVRTVFLLAEIVLCAVHGIGLVFIPLYFFLCAMIPWDDEEKAKAFQAKGHPRLFMAAVACLFFILPALYATMVLPGLEAKYEALGIQVWSAPFQDTLAGRAIDCVSEYRHWLHFQDMTILLALAGATLVVWFMGLMDVSFCRENERRFYEWTTIGLGVVWMCFLILGTFYPLIGAMTPLG